MTVRPLHERITVRRLEEGEQHVGGIIIPDTAKEKPQQGTVIAAGNGKVKDDRTRIPLDVKAGDRILFGKYAGQEIKLDGEEYLIMKEDEVLAVIEGHTKKKLVAIKGKTSERKKKQPHWQLSSTGDERHGTADCAGRPRAPGSPARRSISWPTRSRSPLIPRVATSFRTRSSAHPR